MAQFYAIATYGVDDVDFSDETSFKPLADQVEAFVAILQDDRGRHAPEEFVEQFWGPVLRAGMAAIHPERGLPRDTTSPIPLLPPGTALDPPKRYTVAPLEVMQTLWMSADGVTELREFSVAEYDIKYGHKLRIG
jgi:hypothetical protein